MISLSRIRYHASPTLLFFSIGNDMDPRELEDCVIKEDAYIGIARVDLAALNFDDPINGQHREISEKDVQRLVRIFRIEGCLNLREENFLNVVVDPSRLDAALQEAGLGEEGYAALARDANGRIPHLPLLGVSCLHGLHRVKAAQRFLDEDDQWWPVRLFKNDLPPSNVGQVVNEYANSAPYTDGEIFWRIRTQKRARDERGERTWWARLTPTKSKDLRQLLKKQAFADAFDRLLDIPGLWRSIQLGTLHRLHAMRCDEVSLVIDDLDYAKPRKEMLRYLKHIHQIWSSILEAAPGLSLDAATVEQLEGLAPRSKDFIQIRTLIDSKSVFSNVHNTAVQQELLQKLRAIPGLIPSFNTFFQNLKYLEPCCVALRHLIAPKLKKSICEAFMNSYTPPTNQVVETRDGLYSCVSTPSSRRTAYVQLWLFAMRHFPQLSGTPPRKDPGCTISPQPTPTSILALTKFAKLAISLGFRTRQALDLASKDAFTALSLEFLRDAGGASPAQHTVATVAQALRSVARLEPPTNESEISAMPIESGFRFGRPFQMDHAKDSGQMYLCTMHSVNLPLDGVVSSLFVKRDILHAFLGLFDEEAPSLEGDCAPMPATMPENVPTGSIQDPCQSCQHLQAMVDAQTRALSELQQSTKTEVEQRDALLSSMGDELAQQKQTLTQMEKELEYERREHQQAEKLARDQEALTQTLVHEKTRIAQELQDLNMCQMESLGGMRRLASMRRARISHLEGTEVPRLHEESQSYMRLHAEISEEAQTLRCALQKQTDLVSDREMRNAEMRIQLADSERNNAKNRRNLDEVCDRLEACQQELREAKANVSSLKEQNENVQATADASVTELRRCLELTVHQAEHVAFEQQQLLQATSMAAQQAVIDHHASLNMVRSQTIDELRTQYAEYVETRFVACTTVIDTSGKTRMQTLEGTETFARAWLESCSSVLADPAIKIEICGSDSRTVTDRSVDFIWELWRRSLPHILVVSFPAMSRAKRRLSVVDPPSQKRARQKARLRPIEEGGHLTSASTQQTGASDVEMNDCQTLIVQSPDRQ